MFLLKIYIENETRPCLDCMAFYADALVEGFPWAQPSEGKRKEGGKGVLI